jgi:uncharacterized RDD family membrane protein YckC
MLHIDPLYGGRCDQCGEWHDAVIVSESLSDELNASVDVDELLQMAAEAEAAPEDPLIGQRLGHFLIVARLGGGGMGTVYRALDESLQRYVALKVITERKGRQNAQLVERLLNEARSQARVNHPNVVHIYYVSRDAESPFLAMELVHGPTLAARLRAGPFRFAEIVRFAAQIVEALQQAALYDIVHGDIKPGNILLSDGESVKLSDFGLARRLSRSGGNSDRIAGTPNYISPEACRGEPTDIRSDMYALGVMLFEMTFGRLPYTFAADGPQARIRAHCTAEPEFPDPWPAHVPHQWRAVLERLLAKDPKQRYWTYDVLREDLRRLLPVPRPRAGLLVRGLAWVVDILLAAALQRFVVSLFRDGLVGEYLFSHPPLWMLASFSGLLVPFLVAYLQSRWKTTPGKELLQIRIADEHGLTPEPARLALRTVLPLLPLWHFAVQMICDAGGLPVLAHALAGVVLTVMSADGLTAILRKDRRSLHDLLVRTQVVLDAEPRPASQPAAGAG